MSEQVNKLLEELAAKVSSLPGDVSSRLENVEKELKATKEKTGIDVERKIKFAGDANTRGSKFAGLTSADIQILHGVMKSTPKGPSEELENAFQSVSRNFISNSKLDAVPYRKATQNEGATGFGQELIGVQYLNELWDAARQESRVFALIDAFEMANQQAYLPLVADLPEPQFLGENTTENSFLSGTGRVGSNRVLVTAKKMLINQIWTYELEEDSIIPFLPFVRAQIAASLAFYGDSVILNGDTTTAGTGNINSDDAAPAATKFYLAFDGLRKAGLVDNTANASSMAGAITLAGIAALRGLMMDKTNLIDWGHPVRSDDIIYVCDPQTADKIAQLAEVVTIDKFGPQAGVLTGQIGNILGSPVISTMAMGLTEADGKISATPANNTKGQLIAFNRNAFKVGLRKAVALELERMPGMQQARLVASLRLGLGRYSATGAASGLEGAAVLYNITV
jgi:HK97 family phage major capsid protein